VSGASEAALVQALSSPKTTRADASIAVMAKVQRQAREQAAALVDLIRQTPDHIGRNINTYA